MGGRARPGPEPAAPGRPAGAAAAAAAWPGTGTRRPAGAFAASADQPLRRPVASSVPLPIHWSGEHGRPHRRLRRRERRPVHHLHRVRDGRRLEDDQQRHHLDADLRHVLGLLDRRDRRRSEEPERAVGRHGRGEQPAELLVRRRHLQVDRRRQDVRQPGAQGDSEHRADRDRPEGLEHRLRGSHRPPVRPEPRTRPLQDDRRRQGVDPGESDRRGHRLHGHRDGPRRFEDALRLVLPAAARAVGVQRRRPGERDLEDDRCREDVDQARRRRTAHRAARPHRPGGVCVEPEGGLRPDRGGRERWHGRQRDAPKASRSTRRQGAAAGAAASRRPTNPHRRPTRRRAACGGPTTRARRGGWWATTTTARCTTARSASIRPTPTSSTRWARRSTSPPTAARPSKSWRGSRTAITTRCGSTRRTRSTSSSATTAASTSATTRARPGSS